MELDLTCVTLENEKQTNFCLTDCGPADGCEPDD